MTLKLIKKYLFKELCKWDESPSFTIKKAVKYQIRDFEIFRHITVFGIWIQSQVFLQTFDANEEKGSFPYAYFTSAEQLDETSLPPHETFYSTVKRCNVLEEDYATFQKLLDQGKSKQAPPLPRILCLQEVPKTGPEIYQWLNDLWNENDWTTFADYLQW